MTTFRVYWDNGASACGLFPQVFVSRRDAEDFGWEWADEANVRDFGMADPECEHYTFEVVEVTDEADYSCDNSECGRRVTSPGLCRDCGRR